MYKVKNPILYDLMYLYYHNMFKDQLYLLIKEEIINHKHRLDQL